MQQPAACCSVAVADGCLTPREEDEVASRDRGSLRARQLVTLAKLNLRLSLVFVDVEFPGPPRATPQVPRAFPVSADGAISPKHELKPSRYIRLCSSSKVPRISDHYRQCRFMWKIMQNTYFPSGLRLNGAGTQTSRPVRPALSGPSIPVNVSTLLSSPSTVSLIVVSLPQWPSSRLGVWVVARLRPCILRYFFALILADFLLTSPEQTG